VDFGLVLRRPIGSTGLIRTNAASHLLACMAHARNPSAIVLMTPVTMYLPVGSLVCHEKDQIMAFRLRRVLLPSLLAVVVLISSARCGRKSEASYPAHFPFAYVQMDCGPTDGAALAFYFTLKESQFGKDEQPFINISINTNLPKSAPRDYSIRPGRWDLLASRCLRPGQCDSATSGTLHLAKFIEGQGASGKYELHFKDGSVEKNRFDARWRAGPIMCG